MLAQGLDSQRPLADIATLAPLTMNANSPAFEALLLMARHNIHHLPVMDGTRIVGMITATDLAEQDSTSAVYLAGDIYKQDTLEGRPGSVPRSGYCSKIWRRPTPVPTTPVISSPPSPTR